MSVCVCLFVKFSLTIGPTWFSFTVCFLWVQGKFKTIFLEWLFPPSKKNANEYKKK